MEIFESIGLSVLGGIALLLITEVAKNWFIPSIRGQLQKVPKLDNSVWEGYSPKHKENGPTSRLEIRQTGTKVKAKVIRKVKVGEREFEYFGKISGGQIILTWEEPDGAGYIIGAMVLHLSQDLKSLKGKSTYYSNKYGEVISTNRIYNRI